jgi:hypothetical protein
MYKFCLYNIYKKYVRHTVITELAYVYYYGMNT